MTNNEYRLRTIKIYNACALCSKCEWDLRNVSHNKETRLRTKEVILCGRIKLPKEIDKVPTAHNTEKKEIAKHKQTYSSLVALSNNGKLGLIQNNNDIYKQHFNDDNDIEAVSGKS